MKKTKTQKGITLVALIITIVVLLILAVVAITAIQNEGILGHANNAATQFNQKQEEENGILNGYEGLLNNYTGNSGSITYKAYDIGDEVSIGSESFYVIEASDESKDKVLLLTKECIIADKEDENYLTQSSSTSGVEFSSTNYWEDDFTSSPYDLVETGVPDSSHYAAYTAYQYGVKLGGTGRLMTYSEADALINTSDALEDIIYGEQTFWLGSTNNTANVWVIYGSYGDSDHCFYSDDTYGVRPVIEISKSALS